jgi:hypothetical protein
MKKTITSLAVLLLAGAFFAGTAFALSADRSEAYDENIKIDDKTEFVRGDIEKEISFSNAACSNGDRIKATYDKSVDLPNCVIDVYADNENNQYLFNEDKLTAFLNDSADSSENVKHRITLDEAGDIADGIVASLGLGAYPERSGDFTKTHNTYSFAYKRSVRGFMTDDEILVDITPDGELDNYIVRNSGKFDNLNPSLLDGITNDTLEAYARERAESLYPDSGISFLELSNVKICVGADGKYYISLSVILEEFDGLTFMDNFRYDIG